MSDYLRDGVVEVDGLPRHISAVRVVPDETNVENPNKADTCRMSSEMSSRPQRARKKPRYLFDYVKDDPNFGSKGNVVFV
ncbi:hypothetical protein Ciccas_008047 [Cichlidogyrus casuarinus]|uniref:Uncharacterized protein n=1 Tax=Cichlidogyrus casuarinus TaxID=1844966 RepID=A0ABD2Q176_9PLAT